MRVIPILLFSVLLFSPSITLAQETIVGEDFWSFLEESTSAWVVIGLIAIRQISEVIAKAIPDTEKGVLATIRRVFKILALYIPNKT